MNFTPLNPNQFAQQIANNPNAVLLDVRTDEEVAEDKIPNSIQINIQSPTFEAQTDELDPAKHYYIYCRSGKRSSVACQYLAKKGFENLYNLEGGIMAWKNEHQITQNNQTNG